MRPAERRHGSDRGFRRRTPPQSTPALREVKGITTDRPMGQEPPEPRGRLSQGQSCQMGPRGLTPGRTARCQGGHSEDPTAVQAESRDFPEEGCAAIREQGSEQRAAWGDREAVGLVGGPQAPPERGFPWMKT